MGLNLVQEAVGQEDLEDQGGLEGDEEDPAYHLKMMREYNIKTLSVRT